MEFINSFRWNDKTYLRLFSIRDCCYFCINYDTWFKNPELAIPKLQEIYERRHCACYRSEFKLWLIQGITEYQQYAQNEDAHNKDA